MSACRVGRSVLFAAGTTCRQARACTRSTRPLARRLPRGAARRPRGGLARPRASKHVHTSPTRPAPARTPREPDSRRSLSPAESIGTSSRRQGGQERALSSELHVPPATRPVSCVPRLLGRCSLEGHEGTSSVSETERQAEHEGRAMDGWMALGGDRSPGRHETPLSVWTRVRCAVDVQSEHAAAAHRLTFVRTERRSVGRRSERDSRSIDRAVCVRVLFP